MKKTKRDILNELLALEAVAENPEFVAYATHEIELLDAKKGKNKSETKTQKENRVLRYDMVNAMMNGGKTEYTIPEINKLLPQYDGLSPQKVSGVMVALIAAGVIVRTCVKRTAYFGLTDEASEWLDENATCEETEEA